MASGEAKTKPGSEASTTLGRLFKRSGFHEEQLLKVPYVNYGMMGCVKQKQITVKALFWALFIHP